MTEAEQERAAVVAWLRGKRPSESNKWHGRFAVAIYAIFAPYELCTIIYNLCADAIENREHLKE